MIKTKYVVIIVVIAMLLSAAIGVVGTGLYYSINDLIGDDDTVDVDNSDDEYEIFDKAIYMMDLIEGTFYEDISREDLIDGIYDGIARAVNDPYTTYLNKRDLEDMMIETEGEYGGIGVMVSVDETDNTIIIIGPFKDTPGDKAGLLPGDKIIEINGEPFRGDQLDDAVDIMRGEKGTDVTVKIRRDSDDSVFEVTITRDIIILQTVEHEMLDNNIGYVQISGFEEKTYNDFMGALDDLEKQDMEKLIIDLRNNPGGLLFSVLNTADERVGEGISVYTIDKQGNREEDRSDKKEYDIPMVVLVNGYSASASEILTGVLKDYDKATIIGETTFGKGVVQRIFPLDGETAVKVTISSYYTPNGVNIHGSGIEPDITVSLEEEYQNMRIEDIGFENDLQLQKAIEELIK